MSKLKEIQWHPKNSSVSQVANEGLEFALISDEYKQIHRLVWCKDFLQDVYHGYFNDKVSKIYGFKYDPKESPHVSTDKTMMIIANWKDKQLGDKIKNNALPLIHEVEQKLKISKTKVEQCANTPLRYRKSGIWLLTGSKRWFKAPPMISLYCLLIRMGLVRQEGDDLATTIQKIKDGGIMSYYSDDKNQDMYIIKKAEKGIKRIFEHGDRKLFHLDPKLNYPSNVNGKEVTTYSIHEHSGIVAYSEGRTSSLFPHWHRLDKK